MTGSKVIDEIQILGGLIIIAKDLDFVLDEMDSSGELKRDLHVYMIVP